MSFIPRLFLPPVAKDQNEIILADSAAHYLVKVLRLSEGSPFLGFDEAGGRYEMVLNPTDRKPVTASILKRDPPGPPAFRGTLTLGQSLPKASKMDLILRQGTEAGVNRFIPLLTERSISRPEESQYGHKNERWQKILVEACRQSGRNDLPQLDPVTTWKELLGRFADYDLILLPYEKEAPTLRTVLESRGNTAKILILVGPEGGWTKAEVQEAEGKGAFPVHLPTPILRTETAGIAVVAMVQFFRSHSDQLPG